MGWSDHKKSLLRVFVMCIVMCLSETLISQNSYSVRFRLSTLDTTTNVACYDVQLSNPGTESWRLFGYNFNIFYDANAAIFLRDSVVSDLHVSQSDPRTEVIPRGTVTNSGLAYDSIGFLRVNVSELIDGEGQVFEPNGEWISISQVCFVITLDDITDPSTCFNMNFSDQQSEDATGARPDLIQETDPVTISANLVGIDRIDVIPDRTFNSCFILDEDDEDLCSDGLDNDEDGLMDCDDPSCNAGQLSVERIEIECFRPEGTITVRGGVGDNLTYSIDDGDTFTSDTIFENLAAGIYDIVVARDDILSCAFTSLVVLQAPDCSETDDMACTDGLDNDGDGLIDCADDNCQPLIDTVLTNLPIICPDLRDGELQIISPLTDIEFSIDSGMTYQESGLFDSISAGIYNVFTRNEVTLCAIPYDFNPVIVTPGISCERDPVLPAFYMPNVIAPNNPPNHVLAVNSIEEFQLKSFVVYDRWGNRVFNESDFLSTEEVGWDGRLPNGSIQIGVYVYLLEIDLDGDIVATTGDVLVVN